MSEWYNQGIKPGSIDWENDTLKVLLLKSGSVVDKDHDTVADVIAGSGSGAGDEVDATNYARATLAGKASVVDDTDDKAKVSASDSTFTSLGGAANNDVVAAVIYKEVTNDADSIPVVRVEFASTTNTAGTLTDGTTTDGNNFVVQYNDPIGEIAN